MKSITMQKAEAIGDIENYFEKKFKTIPLIEIRNGHYCLALYVGMGESKGYYRMAETKEGAFRYIDNLKLIPRHTLTFESYMQRAKFILERMERKKEHGERQNQSI